MTVFALYSALVVGSRLKLAVSEGPTTRLGRLLLAGEIVDAEPIMPSHFRVMDAYVLSVVLDGEGTYRDADGREEPLVPGAHTIVLPEFPHWYGTRPGYGWTELFAVFTGPLFDSLADLGLLAAGPRYPQPIPSTDVLRAVLRTRPRSQRAAEHQLLALADWLLDTEDSTESGPALSAEVAHALGRIENDQTGSIPLRTVAAESGLSYDALRRRFVTELGHTPAAFRTARRLQAAATLLRLTDMTHREIARTLGFADEFHFSRRFRAHYGVPPRDYRRP